jgi:hypothetical protein
MANNQTIRILNFGYSVSGSVDLAFSWVILAVIGAITGAIKAQGPRLTRAFIGRAGNSRALVEFELVSSTPHGAYGASNDKVIVRLTGRPDIAEFVIFPDKYVRNGLKGVSAARSPGTVIEDGTCGIVASDRDTRTTKQVDLFIATKVGLAVQAALIVLASVTAHYSLLQGRIESRPQVSAFSCVIAGSTLLLGVGLCSL